VAEHPSGGGYYAPLSAGWGPVGGGGRGPGVDDTCPGAGEELCPSSALSEAKNDCWGGALSGRNAGRWPSWGSAGTSPHKTSARKGGGAGPMVRSLAGYPDRRADRRDADAPWWANGLESHCGSCWARAAGRGSELASVSIMPTVKLRRETMAAREMQGRAGRHPCAPQRAPTGLEE